MKMYSKIDNIVKYLATTLMLFCSQVLITNGQNDYFLITQPPTQLQCNPHSANVSKISLECSVGTSGNTSGSTSGSTSGNTSGSTSEDARIVWFKRHLNSDIEQQLCERSVSTVIAVSPFISPGPTLLLRSIVEVAVNDLGGDLSGEYWCQVAKTPTPGQTLLSNRSAVLFVNNSDYYKEKMLAPCVSGSIFLAVDISGQSVQFNSIPSSVEQCSVDPNVTTPILAIPTDNDVVQDNVGEESFVLSRMWIYILVPVVATILIFTFLLLMVALITTCIRKKDPKKITSSTIDLQGLSSNIKLSTSTAGNSNRKNIQFNGHSENTTALTSMQSCTQPANSSRAAALPVGKGSSSPKVSNKKIDCHHLQKVERDKGSQEELGVGSLNSDEDDEDYYYTNVLPHDNRQAGELHTVGQLKSACAGLLSTETVSDCNAGGGNLGYRSLDPGGMEPIHTYHAACMQSNATSDGLQPAYSEPDIRSSNNNKRVLRNGHWPRPTPPTKIPPRPRNGHHQRSVPQISCRSSVDGEYIEPNSSDLNSRNMYQGLTPSKQEYLALYMTPGSSPH